MRTAKKELSLNNEFGFSSLFHLIFILSVAFLFHHAWEVFIEDQKTAIQIGSLGIFAILILYSLLNLAYSLISGEKSKSQMKKIIKKESKKLSNILNEYSAEVSAIKARLKKLTGIMKPEGFKELAIIEGLLSSLEGRLQKVQQHSSSRDIDEVHYAYASLLEDISNTDSPMYSVTLSHSIEPVALTKLKSNLDQRILRVKRLVPASRARH